jgi:hypothetical protein
MINVHTPAQPDSPPPERSRARDAWAYAEPRLAWLAIVVLLLILIFRGKP